MAQCKQTAQEFVQSAFAPMVAVLCSHDAHQLCQKNNLSFVELVQPFCRLSTEAHVRDPGNISHTMHNFTVNMRDFNAQPPHATLAKKLLNDVVAASQPENTRNNVITVGDYDLQLSANTPWFEAFRECFLNVSQPSDHEFLKHYLACVFVASSSQPDPMDQFTRLTQQQHQQQHQQPNKLPRWFCPNVLRYYVLLHDVTEGEEEKAEAVYQSMKATYGATACHLLQINSRSPNTVETIQEQMNIPDPWSQFLHTKLSSLDAVNAVDTSVSMVSSTKSLTSVDLDNKPVEKVEQNHTGDMLFQHPLADTDNIREDGDGIANDLDNIASRDSQNNSVPLQNHVDSKNPSVRHGACLTLSDHDRLRIFIHEFIVRALIPWSERTMRTLHDQMSSRKGIHKSIFSATKKWFSGNKPVAGPVPTAEKTNVVYTNEAPEMQMRRLADLSFMFQLYEMAYQTYHTLKRDFNNDHAWLHCAGALEMASMAIFMQGSNSQRQYPNHYMESAIATYLTTCKNPQFATRATLLSSEALKSKSLYAEAATQFIKMTSEDSDLRSALLLEQAAHCFINTKTAMVRKYAFHMILAGHRYSKAGQRKHALRSYSQALQVFKGKDWTLAEDHINFTLGRQSFNLKQLENATAAFKHLLTVESRQSAAQQSAFLREFLFVFKQLSQQSPEGMVISQPNLPQLPLPVVDGNTTRILLKSIEPDSAPEGKVSATGVSLEDDEGMCATWQKLEEIVASSLNKGSLPNSFRPHMQVLSNKTPNNNNPLAVREEVITIEVVLQNPLKISLVLTDVMLLWRFLHVNFDDETNLEKLPQQISNADGIMTTSHQEVITTQVLPEITLSGMEDSRLQLTLVPHQTGELHIEGLAYNLGTSPSAAGSAQSLPSSLTAGVPSASSKPSFVSSISVRGCLNLEVQGPRLNSSKQEKVSKMYGPDRRLDLVIVPPMPRLQVHISGIPKTLICGQVRPVSIDFTNVGQIALCNLRIASTSPEYFTFGQYNKMSEGTAEKHYVYQTLPDGSSTRDGEYIDNCPSVEYVQEVPMESEVLEPGATITVPMWIYGPPTPGVHELHFLFYYEVQGNNPKMKHRSVRHTSVIATVPSVSLRAIARRGPGVSPDEMNHKQVNNLNVMLEVGNLYQAVEGSELNILQVSCASCLWSIHHLSTQRHTDIKVSSTEKVLLSLKARRCHCPDSDTKKGVMFSNVTFDQYQIHSAASPCADFYYRSNHDGSFDDVVVEAPSPAFQVIPQKATAQEEWQKDLEDALLADLTLIVLWKVSYRDEAGTMQACMGQHHIKLQNLACSEFTPLPEKNNLENPPVKIIRDPAPPEPPPPSTDLTSQLLKCSLHHPPTAKHPFTRSRLCVVPVTLVIHNCCGRKLEVKISSTAALGCENQEKQQGYTSLYQPYPSTVFSWVGEAASSITLSPAESHMVKLRACFCQPGVYNISVLQLDARPVVDSHNMDIVEQTTLAPSLIIIEDVEKKS